MLTNEQILKENRLSSDESIIAASDYELLAFGHRVEAAVLVEAAKLCDRFAARGMSPKECADALRLAVRRG